MPVAKENAGEDYVVPFGKNKGRRLGDLSERVLEWYAFEYEGPNETLRASARIALKAAEAQRERDADMAREIGCDWPDDPSELICAGNPSDYGDR